MCCNNAAAAKGSLNPGGKCAANAEATEVGGGCDDGGGGEVTDDGVFEADGVRIELTLKSEDAFGDVMVVVGAVEAVVESVVDIGGVVGGVATVVEDDETTSVVVSS